MKATWPEFTVMMLDAIREGRPIQLLEGQAWDVLVEESIRHLAESLGGTVEYVENPEPGRYTTRAFLPVVRLPGQAVSAGEDKYKKRVEELLNRPRGNDVGQAWAMSHENRRKQEEERAAAAGSNRPA